MSTQAPARPAAERPVQRAPVVAQPTGIRLDPIRVLRQNQWKMVIGLFIGGIVGIGSHFTLARVYPRYTGMVLFELRPGIDSPDSFVNRDAPNDDVVERQGQTEAQRILDRSILLAAMRARDIESTAWAQGFRDASGTFDIESAVDDLEEDLGAVYRKRTQFFTLSWTTSVKEDIPIVLNQIADTYRQRRESQESERFSQNLSVYNDRIQSVDTQLNTLGLEIGEFIQARNITGDKAAVEVYQRMEDTARRANETKGQRSMAESRRDQTNMKLNGTMEPSPDDIRQAEEDPVLLRLASSVKDSNIFAESMRQKFGESHPEYRNAQRYSEAAKLEYEAELKKILNRNLTADLKLYSDQLESFSRMLKEFEDDFEKQSERLKDYSAAFSELEQKKDRQARLQEQRSKLMDLVMDLNALKVREDAKAVMIAARAQTPREMSFPQLKILAPMGAVLGLFLTLAVAFLRELVDQRVRYTSDLTGIGGRLLGMVPDVEEDPTGVKRAENAIREAPQSVIAESLRQTTSHILKHVRSGGHRTILFVGGLPGAGVTAILTNVAESIAQSGKRVLVIDADFRRPSLAQALGLDPNQPGLGDLVIGKAQLGKVASRFTDSIDFVSAGTPESRIFERLATPAMDEVLAQAKQSYDIVLLDSPPAIVAGDAMVLAAKVDATVLVVRAFQEQRGLVSRLCSQLNDMPSQLVGIVLNRPRNTAGGYFRKNYEVMASYAKSS